MSAFGKTSGNRAPLDSSGVEALITGRATPNCDQNGRALRTPLFFGVGEAMHGVGQRSGRRHTSKDRQDMMNSDTAFAVSTGHLRPLDSSAARALIQGQSSPKKDQQGDLLEHPLFFGLHCHGDGTSGRTPSKERAILEATLPRRKGITAMREFLGPPDSKRSWTSRSSASRIPSRSSSPSRRAPVGVSERAAGLASMSPAQLPKPQPVAAAAPWRKDTCRSRTRSNDKFDLRGGRASSRDSSARGSPLLSGRSSPRRSRCASRDSSPKQSRPSSRCLSSRGSVSGAEQNPFRSLKSSSPKASALLPGEELINKSPSSSRQSTAQPVAVLPPGKSLDMAEHGRENYESLDVARSDVHVHMVRPAGKPSDVPGHSLVSGDHANAGGHATPSSGGIQRDPEMLETRNRSYRGGGTPSGVSSTRSQDGERQRDQRIVELKDTLQKLQKAQAALSSDTEGPLARMSPPPEPALQSLLPARSSSLSSRATGTGQESFRELQRISSPISTPSRNAQQQRRKVEGTCSNSTLSTVASSGSRSYKGAAISDRRSSGSTRRSSSVPSQPSQPRSFSSSDLPLHKTHDDGVPKCEGDSSLHKFHENGDKSVRNPAPPHKDQGDISTHVDASRRETDAGIRDISVDQLPRPLPLPISGRGPHMKTVASQTILKDPTLGDGKRNVSTSSNSASSFTWPWRSERDGQMLEKIRLWPPSLNSHSEKGSSSSRLASEGSPNPLVERWQQLAAPREFERAMTPTIRGSSASLRTSSSRGRTYSDRWRWLDLPSYRAAASSSPTRRDRDEIFSDRIRSYSKFDESPYALPVYAEVDIEPHATQRETGRKAYRQHLAPSKTWMHWVGSGEMSSDRARPLALGDPQTLAKPLTEQLPPPLKMESAAAPSAGGGRASWHARHGSAGPAKTHRQGPRLTSSATAWSALTEPLPAYG